MEILLVTAVVAERDACLETFDTAVASVGPYDALVALTPAAAVTAVAGGVGPSAAASVTATALALGSYDLALNVGVAGAFREGGLAEGDVAVANVITAADLGAWAPAGFLDLSVMGLDGAGGVACPSTWVEHVHQQLLLAGVPSRCGMILTLSAMTGTDSRAIELFERHHALAEAMEGAGMAEAATRWGLPVMEIRSMSNLVGDRDREVWQLGPALGRLSEVCSVIFSTPWPAL